MALSCPSTHWSVIPNRKRGTFCCQQKDIILLYYASRKMEKSPRLPPLSQWTTVTPQSMRSLYTSNSHGLLGLCLQQPLWTAPFLYKRASLSFVVWTCTWQVNCSSLLFLNKPILLKNYLIIYLFKVNKTNQRVQDFLCGWIPKCDHRVGLLTRSRAKGL